MNLDALLAAIPAGVEDSYGIVSVTVAAGDWRVAVASARSDLGCDYFDFLSAVEDADGFGVVCHLATTAPFAHLVLRTLLPREAPAVASIAEVYAGAAWHERETAEMFGIAFLDSAGNPLPLGPLLLPPGFDGHPLRKDFPLASRRDRPWPGAKEGSR